MHKYLEKIKKSEGQPKVIRNILSKDEINKFIDLYNELLLQFTIKNKM